MVYKPFNQAVHDACDPPAREAVIRFHESRGYYAKPFDKYKVDLIIENEFMVPVGYAEVELRSWNICQYQTIHVPERKKKLVENDMPTTYFAVANDLKTAWWCTAEDILGSPLIEVKNKDVANGEYFYDVPIQKFRCVDLQ